LANPDVGQYLNRHFASAFQKVATFQINGGRKQGGNVAAYFATPEGRVLHAVAGPVNAETFLREARWVHDTFELAQLHQLPAAELRVFFGKAHRERLRLEQSVCLPEGPLPHPDTVTANLLDQLLVQHRCPGLGNQGKIHLLLASVPMPRVDQLYQVVFERVLNERPSTSPVRVVGR
jgi:hypothetical protein